MNWRDRRLAVEITFRALTSVRGGGRMQKVVEVGGAGGADAMIMRTPNWVILLIVAMLVCILYLMWRLAELSGNAEYLFD